MVENLEMQRNTKENDKNQLLIPSTLETWS